eukprot:131058_1
MTESELAKDATDEMIAETTIETQIHTSKSGSAVIGLRDDHSPAQKDKQEKDKSRKRKHHESGANDTSVNNDPWPPKKKRKLDDANKQHAPNTTCDDDIVLTRAQILNKIEFLQLSLLSKFNNHLQHAFFTRNGG